jgi:hypothetical protein
MTMEKTRQKYGPRSEETKRKISKALKGRKCSKQHIENNRLARLGKKPSIETKKKMSQSQKLAWKKRKEKNIE